MSILLSGIGNDIHCVAIRLIEIELQHRQVNSINLGAANSFDYIKHKIREYSGSVLVLSSTNGEFYEWRSELRSLIEFFPKLSVLAGGNFLIGDYSDLEIEREFRGLGCSEVFSRRGSIVEICDVIQSYAKFNSKL